METVVTQLANKNVLGLVLQLKAKTLLVLISAGIVIVNQQNVRLVMTVIL